MAPTLEEYFKVFATREEIIDKAALELDNDAIANFVNEYSDVIFEARDINIKTKNRSQKHRFMFLQDYLQKYFRNHSRDNAVYRAIFAKI